jgi:SAM-dependent methyltransferase
MDRIPRSKNYSCVANIYDHIMRKVHYDYWADYIYSISSDRIGSKPRVLELASGNCQLAHYLSAYYPKLCATDISLAMLIRGKKTDTKKVCCDMRMIPFKGKFDLIVSAFDSLNYLLTKKDLTALFREVNRLLSENGLFTFDVSLEKNSYKHIKEPIRKGTYKGIKYTQESDYDSAKKIHRNNFYITFQDGKINKEVHLQKIYSFETYFDLIESVGLIIKECLEAFTFKDANANSPRAQFIVMKK